MDGSHKNADLDTRSLRMSKNCAAYDDIALDLEQLEMEPEEPELLFHDQVLETGECIGCKAVLEPRDQRFIESVPGIHCEGCCDDAENALRAQFEYELESENTEENQ